MVLRPPVAPMLGQAAEGIPSQPRTGLGLACEQKYDGYWLLVFTLREPGGRVLLQTRSGALVQDAFPDLMAAPSSSSWAATTRTAGCARPAGRAMGPCSWSR
ncbi:hypothetical protein [Streptomyces sp. NBC_01276]|uniref:hypothetical protein n=1 Tax=Streptomyces sp. NBC_01276 TaxID=2903808 RepID=UPI00352EA56F